MIQHTVALRLNDDADAVEFLAHARGLAAIPGVKDFQVLRQVGTKNDFTHALSMYFETARHYEAYNDHPDHLAFVENVWIPDVADFIELDYHVLDT